MFSKYYPSFLKKWDQELLIRYPAVWNSRLLYFVVFGLVLGTILSYVATLPYQNSGEVFAELKQAYENNPHDGYNHFDYKEEIIPRYSTIPLLLMFLVYVYWLVILSRKAHPFQEGNLWTQVGIRMLLAIACFSILLINLRILANPLFQLSTSNSGDIRGITSLTWLLLLPILTTLALMIQRYSLLEILGIITFGLLYLFLLVGIFSNFAGYDFALNFMIICMIAHVVLLPLYVWTRKRQTFFSRAVFLCLILGLTPSLHFLYELLHSGEMPDWNQAMEELGILQLVVLTIATLLLQLSLAYQFFRLEAAPRRIV